MPRKRARKMNPNSLKNLKNLAGDSLSLTPAEEARVRILLKDVRIDQERAEPRVRLLVLTERQYAVALEAGQASRASELADAMRSLEIGLGLDVKTKSPRNAPPETLELVRQFAKSNALVDWSNLEPVRTLQERRRSLVHRMLDAKTLDEARHSDDEASPPVAPGARQDAILAETREIEQGLTALKDAEFPGLYRRALEQAVLRHGIATDSLDASWFQAPA